MRQFSHVLCPVDFSETSVRATTYAKAFARWYGAGLTLLHVVPTLDAAIEPVVGLVEAERILRRVDGIATTHFTSADVVRHPLVARIVEAYGRADRGE